MKLTLCIATFNEEANLHHPLDSCIDWVDEAVIVDGGSQDKTIAVARSYGKKVRVIETDNPIIFHVNKQKAIEAAKGEWILQLDADEAISPDLKKEILDTIGSSSASDGYWIPRRNFFLTRFLTKGGVYPDSTIRLYRNGAARFPCKTVHENVDINGSVGHLKHDILHYADPDFERYLMRWNRYTTLDAELLVKEGKKLCFPCYFFGKPVGTFVSMFVLHKGFMDGFAGFVFALFSSIRYWVIYVKVRQLQRSHTK